MTANDNRSNDPIMDENETKRRLFYEAPFHFPYASIRELIFDVLPIQNSVAMRLVNYMCQQSSKKVLNIEGIDGPKKTIMIDLAETRWQSRDSIAQAISKSGIEIDRKSVEHAEYRLQKEGFIMIYCLRGQRGQNNTRFVAFSPMFLNLSKALLLKHPAIPKLNGAFLNNRKGVSENLGKGFPIISETLSENLGNPFLKFRNKNVCNKNGKKKNDVCKKGQSAQDSSSTHTASLFSEKMKTRLTEPTQSPKRTWKTVANDIERFLFIKGKTFVDFEFFNQQYKQLAQLPEDQYQRMKTWISETSKKAEAPASAEINGDFTWEKLFETLFEEARKT